MRKKTKYRNHSALKLNHNKKYREKNVIKCVKLFYKDVINFEKKIYEFTVINIYRIVYGSRKFQQSLENRMRKQ